MKHIISVLACALFITSIYSTVAAQSRTQTKEKRIVHINEVTAMIVEDSTGAVVNRIPVTGVSEYSKKKEEYSRSQTRKTGESVRPEIVDPRINFLDEKGNVKETITIPTIVESRTERDFAGKGDFIVNRTIQSVPFIKNEGKQLLLIKYSFDESYIDPNGKKVRLSESPRTAELSYYDTDGNLMFQMGFREEDPIGDLDVSSNGEIVAIQIWGEIVEAKDPRTIILDKSGNVKITISGFAGIEEISENGKYLAVNNTTTTFYDVDTGSFWQTPSIYRVYSITSDGIVRARDLKNRQNVEIDLTEHIKEDYHEN